MPITLINLQGETVTIRRPSRSLDYVGGRGYVEYINDLDTGAGYSEYKWRVLEAGEDRAPAPRYAGEPRRRGLSKSPAEALHVLMGAMGIPARDHKRAAQAILNLRDEPESFFDLTRAQLDAVRITLERRDQQRRAA